MWKRIDTTTAARQRNRPFPTTTGWNTTTPSQQPSNRRRALPGCSGRVLLLLLLLFLSTWSPVVEGRVITLASSHPRSPTKNYEPQSQPNHNLDDIIQRQQQRHRRHLNSMPRTGTIRALVLLVVFADHTTRTLPSASYFDDLCNNNAAASMKTYFAQQSYGNYQIECDVMDWLVTNVTETDAANREQGLTGADEIQKFFWNVLDQVQTQMEDTKGQFWYFDYDTDSDPAFPNAEGNGFFDSLLVFHSGIGAEHPSDDCFGTPRENRIRSQGHAGSSRGWRSNLGAIRVNGYAIASAFDEPTCNNNPTTLGIPVHEWIHQLDVPDLYNFNFRNTYGGIGGYGLMAAPDGFLDTQGTGAIGSLSPWVKHRLGWLQYTEISSDGSYSVTASQNKAEVYAITKGYGPGEYLLIENRQPIDFDTGIYGNGGILIWHIDDDVGVFMNDRPGFPGQSGWPQNGNHYRVAVKQADGRFELERGINDGDRDDIWLKGMSLGPGDNGATLNTDSYQKGVIVRTGVSIIVTSDTAPVMTFEVSGLGTAAPSSSSTSTPTPTAPSTPGTSPPTAENTSSALRSVSYWNILCSAAFLFLL